MPGNAHRSTPCAQWRQPAPWLLAALLAAALSPGMARAQWFNAADQASIMNQNSVNTGNVVSAQEGARQAGHGQALSSAADEAALGNDAAVKAEIERMMHARKQQLRPEYERRVQRDGRASANTWLRKAASDMGRRDGEALRERLR